MVGKDEWSVLIWKTSTSGAHLYGLKKKSCAHACGCVCVESQRTAQQLPHSLHGADEGGGPVEQPAPEHPTAVLLHPPPAEAHRVPVELQRLVGEQRRTCASW